MVGRFGDRLLSLPGEGLGDPRLRMHVERVKWHRTHLHSIRLNFWEALLKLRASNEGFRVPECMPLFTSILEARRVLCPHGPHRLRASVSSRACNDVVPSPVNDTSFN
jgi:hypothetical protein